MVNFNFVSLPKFVPNQKDFIISAACVSRFEVVDDFEAFQDHQVADKQDDWHFEEIKNGGGRQLVYSKSDFCHAFYFLVSVYITFFEIHI